MHLALQSCHFVFEKVQLWTHMFVEAFYRKLKTVRRYRIDGLIGLFLILKDFVKMKIGKRSHRKWEIRKCCQAVMQINRKAEKDDEELFNILTVLCDSRKNQEQWKQKLQKRKRYRKAVKLLYNMDSSKGSAKEDAYGILVNHEQRPLLQNRK